MTICMKCKWHLYRNGNGDVCICNRFTKTDFVTGGQIPGTCSNNDGACSGFEGKPEPLKKKGWLTKFFGGKEK